MCELISDVLQDLNRQWHVRRTRRVGRAGYSRRGRIGVYGGMNEISRIGFLLNAPDVLRIEIVQFYETGGCVREVELI
jgi:hypothetical protein